MKDFGNMIVLVTGAAGGVGRSTALEFARKGSTVIATDNNNEGLNETRSMLEEINGKSWVMPAELTSSDAVKALADKVIEKHGGVDVIANVAGACMMADFVDSPMDMWKYIVEVNLFGPFHTIHYLLPTMISKKSGHIINVASAAGLFPLSCLSAYTASKYGTVGFSEVLSDELSEHGINVTTVCPGPINTSMAENIHVYGEGLDQMDKMKNGGFMMKLITQPEFYAELIIESVEKDKTGIISPGGVRTIHTASRFFPGVKKLMVKSIRYPLKKMHKK